MLRDGSKFASMFLHPRVDCGIMLDGTIESQDVAS
jgi:hypothetical protein